MNKSLFHANNTAGTELIDDEIIALSVSKRAYTELMMTAQAYEIEIVDLMDMFVFAKMTPELKALRGVDLTKEIIERGNSLLH